MNRKNLYRGILTPSAWDPDLLDPQDFGFLDLDPQKYANPWIHGYQPKTAKNKFLLSKPKYEPLKKEI